MDHRHVLGLAGRRRLRAGHENVLVMPERKKGLSRDPLGLSVLFGLVESSLTRMLGLYVLCILLGIALCIVSGVLLWRH